MALLLSNAKVSTTRTDSATNAISAPLRFVDADIGPPGPKDVAPEGGVIHYVVRLDPSVDIQPQDMLTIQSWGEFTVNTSRAYRVFAAPMTGNFGLEVFRCSVGDWIGR